MRPDLDALPFVAAARFLKIEEPKSKHITVHRLFRTRLWARLLLQSAGIRVILSMVLIHRERCTTAGG